MNDYAAVVSIGNKCPTAMTLQALHLYKESFPFDFIHTTPRLILKYLKDTTEFFPQKNVVRTKDDVWFGHFNINEKYDETIQTFQRRFERLLTLLKTQKKVLFVYTSEADVYNEMGNRYNDNYGDLCAIVEYIKATYGYDNFTIAAIHMNKSYADTKNIINYTITVPDAFLSDDMSTHIEPVFSKYRKTLELIMKDIFLS